MKLNSYVAIFVVALIAVLFYGPFLNNFFAFDDLRYLENIVSGPRAIALGYNAQLRLVSNFAWVPLFWMSEYNPSGYNLFLIILASLNALLIYIFLRNLLKDDLIPLIAAIVFIAAPAGADAIFWRMSISTLLSLFFNLVAINLYLVYLRKNYNRYLSASYCAFLLAIFSKDDAVSLIPILLAVELLFLDGWSQKKLLMKRLSPYVFITLFYLAVSFITLRLLNLKSEVWGFFQFKPLYSLFGGFAAFFIGPDGFIRLSDPRIYVFAVLVPMMLLVTREKKLFVLGCIWILVTFLPSSLTSIVQLEPAIFANSISRFLYTPSAGVAMVMAAVLMGVKDRWKSRATDSLVAVAVLAYLIFSYGRIHERGLQWEAESLPLQTFLYELRDTFAFPKNSHVFVESPPAGRAFIEQALRAFYRDPSITWIKELRSFQIPAGEHAFIIKNDWESPKKLRLAVYDLKSGIMVARSGMVR